MRIGHDERCFFDSLDNGRYHQCEVQIDHGFDVDIKHLPHRWPLMWAFGGLRLEAATFLLEHGANIHLAPPSSEPPLLISALKSCQRSYFMQTERDLRCNKLIDMSASRGLSLDCTDGHGNTLLHLAARFGLMQTTRSLVERGADIDVLNKYGQTPVHAASQHANSDICRLLIGLGADVMLKSNAGETAAKLARRKKNPAVAADVLAMENAKQAQLAIDQAMQAPSLKI